MKNSENSYPGNNWFFLIKKKLSKKGVTILFKSKENDDKIITDLLIRKKGPFFGFCIKGGIYKPLGIYVTKIDKDGVAGLKYIKLLLDLNSIRYNKPDL